jgi:hypothetical protein
MTSKSKTRLQKDRSEQAKRAKFSPLPALIGAIAMAALLAVLQVPPFLILLASAGAALIAGTRVWERR